MQTTAADHARALFSRGTLPSSVVQLRTSPTGAIPAGTVWHWSDEGRGYFCHVAGEEYALMAGRVRELWGRLFLAENWKSVAA